MPSEVRFALVRAMLEKAGWTLSRINGSHHQFTKAGERTLVIPVHRGKVKPGYVREIQKLIAKNEA